MKNVRISDNGAAFLIIVDGLIVAHFNSLGNAWRHVEWMYAIAHQEFTVGEKQIPVKDWINNAHHAGFLDGTNWAEAL